MAITTSKRCDCGYRRRSPGHDEGVHHKHLAIKVHTHGMGKRQETNVMQRRGK